MTVSIFYFFIEHREAKKRARILNFLAAKLKIIEHSMHLKPASLKIEKNVVASYVVVMPKVATSFPF